MAATATATTAQTHRPNPLLKAPPPRSKLACFSFAAYSKTLIHHLQTLDIPILPGLTDHEFTSIESAFHFTFPPDLRSILQEGLPVDPSFPNWRSSSPQQLNVLLNLPLLSLSKNITLHNFWSPSWGTKPSNPNEALGLVKRLFITAPVLIPIYRNCYIPSTPNMAGNPVFYVDDEEVRILSFDVNRFFQEVEFLRRGGVFKPFMRKRRNGVDNKVPAWAATAARRILGGCLEEVFWRLRDGGWREEEVKDLMMMDGCDQSQIKPKNGTRPLIDGDDAAWHTRVLSVVLLRGGWSREDVVYSLDIDDIDGDESLYLELQSPNSCCID
ncbi:hypothetical protein GOBAR_DD22202 [Gossypium barbadense]|nr:hypothetical protein GOBAR_DD22202 [Gossypium barbadense]